MPRTQKALKDLQRSKAQPYTITHQAEAVQAAENAVVTIKARIERTEHAISEKRQELAAVNQQLEVTRREMLKP